MVQFYELSRRSLMHSHGYCLTLYLFLGNVTAITPSEMLQLSPPSDMPPYSYFPSIVIKLYRAPPNPPNTKSFSRLLVFLLSCYYVTQDQQGTISDLRRELRVSDKEHKELLSQVDSDELIHRIREWRGMKQKPFMSAHPVGASSQLLHPHSLAATPQRLSSAVKWRPSPGISSQRPNTYQFNFSSGAPVVESSVSMRDPLIGKKVMIRWPADNTFYEAVITDYNPVDGRHSLVYDINTPDATLEWVNINEVPPDDIRWVNVEPVVPATNQFANEYRPLVNEPVKEALDEIEIFHTDSLIKKVEKVLDGSQFNPSEINKAKQMLKEHEERLIQVISKLAAVCDSGGNEDNAEADIVSV